MLSHTHGMLLSSHILYVDDLVIFVNGRWADIDEAAGQSFEDIRNLVRTDDKDKFAIFFL